MTNIKIGTVIIENTSITNSGDFIGIRYETDMTIEDLARLYDANTSPQISILNEDGTTSALYVNHALTSLTINMVGDQRIVSVALKVTPTELSDADKINEKIELQATDISTLNTSLSDATAKLVEAETRVTELESENKLLIAQIQALSDRNDFVEDCIAEMAAVVYA